MAKVIVSQIVEVLFFFFHIINHTFWWMGVNTNKIVIIDM